MIHKPEQISHKPSLIQLALYEPTLHFFVIAILIFAIYAITQSSNENVLEIDQGEIDARLFLQEMSLGEELSEEQRELVTAYYIEEQILVREALAMELDNDERIHDILAQKMRHVLSGNIIQPTTAELNHHYQRNKEHYQTLTTLKIDELVFNSRESLDDSTLIALDAGRAAEGLLQMQEGTVSLLPNVNNIDLANIFDREFAETVLASELNRWSGPFISNRGQHWLRVVEKQDSKLPALEEIADRVRLEWIAEEEESRLQEEIDKLWNNYSIVITNSRDK